MFLKIMEIDKRQNETPTISLKINSNTDVFQQFYYDCKLFPTIACMFKNSCF